MRLTILLVMTMVFATPTLRATPLDEPLTLNDAISSALENNRTVRNARLDVDKAQTQVAANKTHRLPSLNSYVLGSRQLSHIDLKFERGALGTLDGTPIPTQDTTIRSPGRFSALIINYVTQ